MWYVVLPPRSCFETDIVIPRSISNKTCFILSRMGRGLKRGRDLCGPQSCSQLLLSLPSCLPGHSPGLGMPHDACPTLGRWERKLFDFSRTFPMFQVRTWALKEKEIFENGFNHFPWSQIDIQSPDSNTCSILNGEESFIHFHSFIPCAWYSSEERYAHRGLWVGK